MRVSCGNWKDSLGAKSYTNTGCQRCYMHERVSRAGFGAAAMRGSRECLACAGLPHARSTCQRLGKCSPIAQRFYRLGDPAKRHTPGSSGDPAHDADHRVIPITAPVFEQHRKIFCATWTGRPHRFGEDIRSVSRLAGRAQPVDKSLQRSGRSAIAEPEQVGCDHC